MKFKIRAEISCDDHGSPIYQEESIECKLIIPGYDISIMIIEENDGEININIKERFSINGIGDWRSISKDDFVSSKRVGKNALYRCLNCDKADNCKYLVDDSTIIGHM